MPKKLQKSLQDYLSKIKKPTPQLQFPNPQTFSSSKSWILSGCKHPKTLSFAIDRKQVHGVGNNEDAAATLADIDRFLFENFRSLYLNRLLIPTADLTDSSSPPTYQDLFQTILTQNRRKMQDRVLRLCSVKIRARI